MSNEKISQPAQPASNSLAASGNISWSRDLLLLIVVVGLLLATRLGTMPLANPDEGRYAEIAREMLVSGDWVTPRLNDVYYFEKPPLVYWATAASMAMFGQNAWAARLPNALLALGGVLLTYAATRRMHGRDAGLAAAIVLATSFLFCVLGRILILDMAVSVFMSGALFCFILGVREQPGRTRRLLFYGLYACAALATLSKGLIGFLVSGAVMFFWLLIFNQWRRLLPLYLPTGALLFLAIAAPWHLLAADRNAVWAEFYFVREHWLRFTTTTHGRFEPWWYFIPILLAGIFPWTGYLWPALRKGLAGGWSRRNENADTWFFVTWAAFIFLFFSRSQSKLAPYILPIFPALASILGAWIAAQWRENSLRPFRVGLIVFSIGAGVIGLAAGALAIHPGLIRDRELVESVRWQAVALSGAMLVGTWLTWQLGLTRGVRWAFGAQAATIVAFFLVAAAVVPVVVHRNTKALAEIVTVKVQPSDRVYHYHGFFHDFVFYGGKPVGTVSWPDELELDIDPAARASGRYIDDAEFLRQWTGATRIWAVARKRDVKPLFDNPAFRYHLIGETRQHYLFSNQL
ncbi:MAG: glycosyltransferase family 39 protein [Verrucomicrobia bacterium]|nr:glycosyltransferase family 39 protein [Verrucomicrobiota bacterium]